MGFVPHRSDVRTARGRPRSRAADEITGSLASAESHTEGMAMKDIETESDVRALVDAFYQAVREDTLLNPIFSDFAQVNWTEHLPKMYAFWNGIILGKPGYAGQPFPPHTRLPVTREHFSRWL